MEDIEHIEKEMKLINSDGRRLDGRSFDELRPIRIEAGVLRRADGSADIEWGGDKSLPAGWAARGGAPTPPPGPAAAPPPYPDHNTAFHLAGPKRAPPHPPGPADLQGNA